MERAKRLFGISYGPQWHMSLIVSGTNRLSTCVGCGARIGVGRGEWTCVCQILAERGLRAWSTTAHERCYLRKFEDGACHVLPGFGRFDQHIDRPSRSWADIATNNDDGGRLTPLVTSFLEGLVANIEERAGVAAIPCDGVVIASNGFGSSELLRALAIACEEVLGRVPQIVWQPTALAGLAFHMRGVQRLIAGEQGAIVELEPERDPVEAESSHGWMSQGRRHPSLRVRFRRRELRIHSEVIDPSTSTEQRERPVPAASIRLPFSPDTEQVAGAVGAGLLAAIAQHSGQEYCEQQSYSVWAHETVQNGLEVPIHNLRIQDNEGSVQGGQAFARCIGAKGPVTSSIGLGVSIRQKWSRHQLLLSRNRITPSEVVSKWGSRFPIVVEIDEGACRGKITLIEEKSSKEHSRSFVLPGAGRLGSRLDRSPYEKDAIRRVFQTRPGVSQHRHWDVDCQSRAWYLLSRLPGKAPVDAVTGLEICVVGFGRFRTKIRAALNGEERDIGHTKHVEKNLRIHRARLVDPMEVQSCVEGTDNSTEVLRWSVLRADEIAQIGSRKSDRAGSKRATGMKAMVPVIEGHLLLEPHHYSVSGNIQWQAADCIVDCPVPIGARVSRDNAKWDLALSPTGVSAASDDDGDLVVTDVCRGVLHLNSSSKMAVLVELFPRRGIRIVRRDITLVPGSGVSVPISRRKSVTYDAGESGGELSVECLITPMENGEPVGPVSRLVVNTKLADSRPAVCLPSSSRIGLDLGWLPEGESYSVPVTLTGKRSGMVGLRYPDVDPNERPARLIVLDDVEEGNARGMLSIPFMRLEFARMLGSCIEGKDVSLELMQEVNGDVLTIPLALKVRLAGVMALSRRVFLTYRAGRPTEFCLPVFCESERFNGLHVNSGANRTSMVPVDVRLAASPKDGQVDEPLDLRLDYDAIGPLANANTSRVQQLRLQMMPRAKSGWSRGDWTGAIQLRSHDGNILDDIEFTATSVPWQPEFSLKLKEGADKNQIRFQVSVKNTNPGAPLALKSLHARAQMEMKVGPVGFGVCQCDELKADLQSKNFVISPKGESVIQASLSLPKGRWARFRGRRANTIRLMLTISAVADAGLGGGAKWESEKRFSI